MHIEKIPYYMTDNLTKYLDQYNDDRFNKFVHEGLEFHINQYKKIKSKADPVSVAANYHSNIDCEVEKEKKSYFSDNKDEQITCKKGCNFCCYSEVIVTIEEIELIKTYLDEDNIVIDLQLLEKQATSEWEKLIHNDKKCILLDDKGECKVYKYRPIPCRKLMVKTDPEMCDFSEKVKNVARLASLEAEIMASALLNATKVDSLPKLLWEKFR